MKKTNLALGIAFTSLLFIGCSVDDETQDFTTDIIVTDYDGNIYNTVEIGNQIWMDENLKVTHYPDGTEIPLVQNDTVWKSLGNNSIDDAYCYYYNNTNSEYGALYTWAAAINKGGSSANSSHVQGVCPSGWHLPSDEEWLALENFVAKDGYEGQEGKALKTINGWSSDGNGIDKYGFSALPAGYRSGYHGTFGSAGKHGYWQLSTEHDGDYVLVGAINYYDDGMYRLNTSGLKSDGISVRCIKNN